MNNQQSQDNLEQVYAKRRMVKFPDKAKRKRRYSLACLGRIPTASSILNIAPLSWLIESTTSAEYIVMYQPTQLLLLLLLKRLAKFPMKLSSLLLIMEKRDESALCRKA